MIYAFDPAGPSLTEGAWKVVATPAPGYTLADGSVTEWTGNLGAHTTCPVIPDGDPVPFCHATNAEGNAYTVPITSAAGIIGAYLDHIGDLAVWYPGAKADGHTWGDIIPPFIYDGNGYSLNWDGTGAQIIWNNNCAAVLVTPEPPTRADACDQDGSVSLPNTVGVKYEFTVGNGVTGSQTVTATPQPGYEFTQGATTSWSGVVEDPGPCTVIKDATPDVTTTPTCGDHGGPIIHVVDGVIYEFTVGNGIDGPWEITAFWATKSNYLITTTCRIMTTRRILTTRLVMTTRLIRPIGPIGPIQSAWCFPTQGECHAVGFRSAAC